MTQPDLHAEIKRQVRGLLDNEQLSDARQLALATRLLAKYRSELVRSHVLARYPVRVQSGPFEGMQLLPGSAEGCYVPKLLGTYETEVHDLVQRWISIGYERVLKIGSAEGYYAVGLARLLPNCQIDAFDTNPQAQKMCRQLSALNQVENQIHWGGEFTPDQFADYAQARTLVICDIEGNERGLLNPALAPTLQQLDLFVELHDLVDPNLSREVLSRFVTTHRIEVLAARERHPSQFECLSDLGELDQWIAVWEWRSGPTPWVMLWANSNPVSESTAKEPEEA